LWLFVADGEGMQLRDERRDQMHLAGDDVVAPIAFVLQQELMERVVDRLRAAFKAAREA
jgi:hypothetical protein